MSLTNRMLIRDYQAGQYPPSEGWMDSTPWTIPLVHGIEEQRSFFGPRLTSLHSYVSWMPVGQLALTTKNDDATVHEHRVREALNAGNVIKARQLLDHAMARGASSDQLMRWKIALAIPKAMKGKPGTSRGTELIQAWLKANGAKHRGQWVVFVSGQYRVHGKDRGELRAALARESQLSQATFVRIPE